MGVQDKNLFFGNFARGPRNLITDVPGVRVGHCTLDDGDIQTGVTAIIPAPGNLFREMVPAACHIINGFGKSAGLIQIAELGTVETPIVLTNTFGVGTGINALVRRALEENPEIGVSTSTVNATVMECNDAYLNDIRGMHVTEQHVFAALDAAGEDFAEGAVGGGRGMSCYQLKGGIGSASRVLTIGDKTYTIGALLMTNFGRKPYLRIDGDPVGRRLADPVPQPDKGSCIIVLGTDLPLSTRQMSRICRRAQSGLARTGAYVGGGSGEIVVMFSNAARIPHFRGEDDVLSAAFLHERNLDSVFAAATDCVEESVISSLMHAETLHGIREHSRKSLADALAELE